LTNRDKAAHGDGVESIQPTSTGTVYITVISASIAPSGEAAVSSTARGFDGRAFSATYPNDHIAEEVAHAIAAVLYGHGVVSIINGCECAGLHHHDPVEFRG
jgi:energy-coupling factor transporter transmembrane protein EcfT